MRLPIGRTKALLVCAGVAASCTGGRQSATPVAERMSEPASARAVGSIGSREASGPPIAAVNGHELPRRQFMSHLVESHGLALLQRWMVLDLAREEAKRLGVEVTSGDVDREYDLTLRDGLAQAADAPAWTGPQRERFIDELIRLRGWSRYEMNLVMERQSIMRKIAGTQVTVDAQSLKAEFARRHGEKAVVRHIELAAPRWWDPLKQQLEQGVDFKELVAHYSQNRASRDNDGLLPPFTSEDPEIPGAFRAVAFALSPGQVSNPITFEGKLHVLKLEKRIPADAVKFEEVRDQLRDTLTQERVERRMAELSADLLQNCRLRIHDPVLRRQYKERLEQGELAGPTLEP